MAQPAALLGCRILVAEDEYMVARETVEVLVEAGAEPLGPVPSVADALALMARTEGRINAGLLDVSLRDDKVWPLVDVLLAQNIPVILATGYDTSAIPQAYAGLPRCEKPVERRHLLRTLEQVLAAAGQA